MIGASENAEIVATEKIIVEKMFDVVRSSNGGMTN